MEPSKSPTIHDVAKRAGVSLSTVSRVINGHPSVSPQTRGRVEAAIRDLQYEKTKTEQVRPARKMKAVGLIVPDILNPFFACLIKGIEHVSRIHNYSLILCDSENNAAIEQQHLNALADRAVDGIIIIPSSETVSVDRLVRNNVPFVFLDRFLEIKGANYVISDNEEGAFQAVKYLLKLGHRRIVNLTGPQYLSTEKERFKGYQRALLEEGIEQNEEFIICGNYELEDAYHEVAALLKKHVTFTAIFATNDIMAFGAKQALEEQGFNVPDDVSLVGYDDIRFSLTLSLTSVAQPTHEMGRNAMVLLIDLIKGRIQTPQHIVLRPSMVIRSSCKRK